MNQQLWAATAVIVGGYVVGIYFQNRSIAHLDKRIDDLRAEMNARFSAIDKRFDDLNKRFDDLKDWLRAEFRLLERIEPPVPRP